MMTALASPQAQTGLATILAALGPATPADSDAGGFEQLLAKLPGSVASGAGTLPAGPIALTPPSNTPVPAAPSAVVDGEADMVLPMATTLPTATATAPLASAISPLRSQPGAASVQISDASTAIGAILPEASAEPSPAPAAKPAEATPTPDAAVAASLLIAVATPRATAKPAVDAPGKPLEKADAKADDAGGDAPVGPDAPDARTAEPPVVTAVIADPAQSAPVSAAAAAAAAMVANAAPAPTGRTAKTAETEDAAPRSTAATTILPATAAKTAAAKPAREDAVAAAPARPADKPVETAAAKPAREAALAPASASARSARVESAALPTAAAKPATDPAPLKPAPLRPVADSGASMAVLFGQPAAPGVAAPALAQAAAPVTERLLDMGSDDQWIAQLATDIAATKSESGDLSFRLMPRHLGRLDVAMKMDDSGGVSLKLDTQHEATATIVTAAQPRLVEDLRQQGVRVAEAQVTHTPAETGRQQQQQGQSGRNAAPNASHLIETAPERPGADRNERAADRRGRFA
ncbi:flagellar hook-length control protein FliK [Sphingopyxis sp.]|uniref:flagellar hook-length control protein FliK n=1 Tax=Sphingopyxis sp. TaxID=1908224 RepID=UPI00262F4035|nr:flagellar hook-length control protein FliK [Sphingopyxis sp.]MCW0200194.1 flagellar hook-length control protein FliK [Sphingopyxis sp.]